MNSRDDGPGDNRAIKQALEELGLDPAAFSRDTAERQLRVDRRLLEYIYETRRMLLHAAITIAKLSARVQKLEGATRGKPRS